MYVHNVCCVKPSQFPVALSLPMNSLHVQINTSSKSARSLKHLLLQQQADINTHVRFPPVSMTFVCCLVARTNILIFIWA